MLYHHDQRDYKQAVGDTAKKFKDKLDALIVKGRSSAGELIDRISREIPEDRIVPSRALSFGTEGQLVRLVARGEDHEYEAPMHRHALGQVADRAGIPDLYVSRLLERPWGAGLLAANLSYIMEREEPKKFLLRSVNGEVKGVLSNAFRRMDSRPIIEAFAKACGHIGAVPVEGVGGDLRFSLRALLPMVFRPGGDEIVAFGVALANSDFGCGALSCRAFMLRVWCTNTAELEEALRQVHLGRRLGEDMEFSNRTHKLDTDTMVSAVEDIVVNTLSPVAVEKNVALIEKAMSQQIDPKAGLADLTKRGVLKKELEAVRDIYVNGGVEQLPPGDNLYRMSNAISWVAKQAETPERRLELEQVAGELLLPAKKAA